MDEPITVAVFIIFHVVCGGIYLFPSFIALGNDRPYKYTLTFFNVAFGWTGIVWFICLVFAVEDPPEEGNTENENPLP